MSYNKFQDNICQSGHWLWQQVSSCCCC